jgi:hypothetical protein
MANKIHKKYGNNIQNAIVRFFTQLIHSKYAVSAIMAKIITSEIFGFWSPKNTTLQEKFSNICASYGAI